MIVNTHPETRYTIELTRIEVQNLLTGKDVEELCDFSVGLTSSRFCIYCSDPISNENPLSISEIPQSKTIVVPISGYYHLTYEDGRTILHYLEEGKPKVFADAHLIKKIVFER